MNGERGDHRGKFYRALNTAFLIGVGIPRLRKPCLLSCSLHQVEQPPYLIWEGRSYLLGLGGLHPKRNCTSSVDYGLPVPLYFPNLYHKQNHLVGVEVTVKIQISGSPPRAIKSESHEDGPGNKYRSSAD